MDSLVGFGDADRAAVAFRALASAGLIAERHATHPRGSGPITYWRANVDSVLTTLDAVVAHVTDLIDERWTGPTVDLVDTSNKRHPLRAA